MSVVGFVVSATILDVHHNIDTLGDGYTSFCTVNDSINCDRVLSSPYAKIAGVPVAGLAIAAYLGLAGLFGAAAAQRDRDARARMLGLGAIGVIGSLVFSAYMAVIAVWKLQTLCLLCMGLYAVSLTNAGLLLAALAGSRRATGRAAIAPRTAGAVAALGVAACVGLAWATWPRTEEALSASIRTADDVRAADPAFYAFYTALPRSDVASLLREGQAATIAPGKVVIVDFFDLECAHCRKNHQLAKKLRENRPDQVVLVHRHFPLDASCNDIVPASLHPNACRAAEAMECAGLMGKGDEMLEIMFANQSQLFAENLPRLAAKIGLDRAEFERCLAEGRTRATVLADARAGAKLEITSTPTIFVNGRRLKGGLEEVGKYEMAVVIEADAKD